MANKIPSFLAELERDPISALNLRFIEKEGFAADPFDLGGEVLTGGIHVIKSPGEPGEWGPPEYREGTTTIEPLGRLMSAWGVMVAIRVAHQDPDFRLKLDWFNKSDPASSSTSLIPPAVRSTS